MFGENDESLAANLREGPVARGIEHQTARLPSDVYLWAGLACGAAAWVLHFSGKSRGSVAPLVGQLLPTMLLFGIYNKLVKVAGSDQLERTLH